MAQAPCSAPPSLCTSWVIPGTFLVFPDTLQGRLLSSVSWRLWSTPGKRRSWFWMLWKLVGPLGGLFQCCGERNWRALKSCGHLDAGKSPPGCFCSSFGE